METKRKKQHADFQDTYRRSSNFSNVNRKENLKPRKDGKVILLKKQDEEE